MDDKKQSLRAHYMSVRKAIPAREAERLSARIAANICSLPRLLESDLVMLYHRLGAEVDTGVLTEIVLDSGRGVALPYCRGDGSIGVGRIFSPQDDLAPGAHGVMEPLERLRDNICASRIGVVVCPGVAFDAARVRLGRGGGRYDRFLRGLSGSAFLVGCAFDCQISGAPLPREEHDVPMDVVVTEKRAFPGGACPAIALADGKLYGWSGEEDRYADGGEKNLDGKSAAPLC